MPKRDKTKQIKPLIYVICMTKTIIIKNIYEKIYMHNHLLLPKKKTKTFTSQLETWAIHSFL